MGIQDLPDGKTNVSGGLARSLREPEDILGAAKSLLAGLIRR